MSSRFGSLMEPCFKYYMRWKRRNLKHPHVGQASEKKSVKCLFHHTSYASYAFVKCMYYKQSFRSSCIHVLFKQKYNVQILGNWSQCMHETCESKQLRGNLHVMRDTCTCSSTEPVPQTKQQDHITCTEFLRKKMICCM